MPTLRITPYVDLQPKDVLPRPTGEGRDSPTTAAAPASLHPVQVWKDENGRSHQTGEGWYWFRTSRGEYFTRAHADEFDAITSARKEWITYEGPAMMRNI